LIQTHNMCMFVYLGVYEDKNKSYGEDEVIIKMRITERAVVGM
jgi:hypothetical protein